MPVRLAGTDACRLERDEGQAQTGVLLKLVFVCNEYPPGVAGGIGVMLRALCEPLAERGHDVHVVGCYPVAKPVVERVAGVQVHRLPHRAGRLGMLANRLAMYLCLRRIDAQGSIDIIESPDFEAPAALLPRQSRKRVVRLHGSHVYFAHERGQAPSRSIDWLEKQALRQADAWIPVSQYTASRTQALFALDRPVHVVHNAVRVPDGIARKHDYETTRRVVYFGTLAEKKGVFTLARAWVHFHATHPDWTLSVIGPDATYLGRSVREQMVDLLGNALPSVKFIGPLSNEALLSELPAFDFAVLPSFSEAFAMAPMEAMALGVPVVFSRYSSGPELIAHGKNGWLADPADDQQLAALLVEVADDPAKREQIGRAGRQTVAQDFSHDAFVDRNLAVYAQLLGVSEGAT